MANIKEVWIDHVSLTLKLDDGATSVIVEGQTYAADGLPIRHFGPTDIYAALTAAEKKQIASWVARAQDAVQTEFSIADTDLITTSPLPVSGPVTMPPPFVEPLSVARKP